MELLVSLAVMISVLLFIYTLMRLYRRYRLQHYEVPARDVSKGHRWYMVDEYPEPTCCNISHYHITHGAKCDSCGVCVDDHNMQEADLKFPCKPQTKDNLDTHHFWMEGNLPLYSKCYVCGKECGMLTHIVDFRCCWCFRTVHGTCLPETEVCDLGAFRNVIVPPHCVRLKWVGIKGRKHLVVGSAEVAAISNWSPVVVITNRRSGNNDGEYLLRAFRGILNPTQVIDLHDIPPENGLEWCHLLPDVTFRILVCGGDGTVGWVLNAIEKLKLKMPPQVCILPLGTGNDLSRVLGWGDGFTKDDVEVSEILHQITLAKPVMLDRWKIKIKHEKHLGISRPGKTIVMNNYVSLGVDALVTLNFHKQRESRPWLFANRLINKMAYLTYGTKDCLERECKDLHKKLKVELDGRLIELPEIEGLVVLNISSWGGGCRPWQPLEDDNQFQPARCDDGLLEVMALYSSFHIAQMQVGLTSPIYIGQAKNIKIRLFDGNAPMQVDGEPWEQHPAEINITHNTQATMLSRNNQ